MEPLKGIGAAALAIVAAFLAPACAQSAMPPAGEVIDYDYGKPCRFYLVRHLPAPGRCLVEFQGYWGPGAVIDGDFIFHDRDSYLRWRDREDYKHWRMHDFHWHGGGDQQSPAAVHPATERPGGHDKTLDNPGH